MPKVKIKGTNDVINFPDSLSEEKIKQALSQMYSTPATQAISDRLSIQPTASPVERTFSEMLSDKIGNTLYDTGVISDRYRARDTGRTLGTMAEFTPPVASAMAGDAFGGEVKQGDYLGAGLSALEGSLEVNPLTGALASVVPVIAKKGKGLLDGIGEISDIYNNEIPSNNMLDEIELTNQKISDNDFKDLTLFHGTTKDFSTPKSSDRGSYSQGFYLTNSPEKASSYAKLKDITTGRKGGQNVMPYKASFDNPYIANPDVDFNINTDEIKNAGYDGIIVKNSFGDGKHEVVSLYPERLTGLFDTIGDTNLDLNKVNFGEVNGQFTTETTERAVQESGGLRGSTGILEQSVWQSPSYAPAVQREQGQKLVGLPDVEGFEVRNDPVISSIAQDYMGSRGEPYVPQSIYKPANPARGKEIAKMFDEMPHNPSDPEVQRAYNALATETLDQYKYLVDNGYTFDFIDFNKMDDPYPNPRMAIEDVRNNKHMWIFPTDDGFGSGDFDPADNPLLAVTDFEISGKPAMVNDIFRAVHDVFGHAKESAGFRAGGEETAWRMHSGMYSPLARRALTTETRGQNSWVNFGKFGEKNKTASPADTTYADQKIGLLPEWVSESYADNYTDKFDEVLDKGLLDRL